MSNDKYLADMLTNKAKIILYGIMQDITHDELRDSTSRELNEFVDTIIAAAVYKMIELGKEKEGE
jgi:hypothetical protein